MAARGTIRDMTKTTLSKPLATDLASTPKIARGKQTHAARNDLERIEADYRAGILTTREIGKLHGISHTRVYQYAKKHGWQRDLTAKVQAAAAAKLAAADSPQRKAAEAEVVDISAQVLVQVVLAHRASIRRTRHLVNNMLGELEAAAPGAGLDEALKAVTKAKKMRDEEAQAVKSKVGQLLSISNRANVLGQLVAVLDRAITLERKAFSMDDDSKPLSGAPQADSGPSAALLALRDRIQAVVAAEGER